MGAAAFSLDTPGRAALSLRNSLGRRVAVLADDEFAAERHEVALASTDLAPGVYVLRLQAASAYAPDR